MPLGVAIAFAEIAPAGHHLMVHQKLNHFTLIPTPIAFESPGWTVFWLKFKTFKFTSQWPPPESIWKEVNLLRTQFFSQLFRLFMILPDGLPGQPRWHGQPSIKKTHIFKDHFLNKIIKSQTTGNATAHLHNGIHSHLKNFNKIFQDDFKRKTDALGFVIIYIYLLFQSL